MDELGDLNDKYEEINGDLNRTVSDLQETNGELRDTVDNLDTSVQELNATVANLETAIDNLEEENLRYATLNAQLGTISSYLNESAVSLDRSYEQIVAALAEQITANRELVLETLENTYIQGIMNWDCSFRDVFRGEPFVNNEDLIIGSALPAVVEHVEDRVLVEICVNTTDFENYLDDRYSLNLVSVNQIYQAVAVYSAAVMDYYFPNQGEVGLTPDDWAKANYTCENIVPFSYSML